MATPVLYAFSLCILCALVFAKPVAQESEQVQSTPKTNSVLKFDTQSVRDLEPVLTFDSFVNPSSENASVKRRVRRNTIKGNGCPGEMIKFTNRCLTFEEYERILKAVEDE